MNKKEQTHLQRKHIYMSTNIGGVAMGSWQYFVVLFFEMVLLLHAATPELQNIIKRQQILEDEIIKLQQIDKEQRDRIDCLEKELKVLKQQQQITSGVNADGHQSFNATNVVNGQAGIKRQSRILLKSTTTNVTALPRLGNPVAFTARIDPYIVEHVGTNQHIVFNTVLTNIGGAYHPLHGLFIVPRSGIYLIASSILADYTTGSIGVHAAIVVNGNTVARMFAFAETSSGHRDQGAQTVFLNLTRNDEVWVKNIDFKDTAIGGDKYATFSGCLIWPFD